MGRIARAYGIKNSKTCIAGALRRQEVTPRTPAENSRKYTVNPHKFDVIDSESSAYWLGFLMCDGHIGRKSLIVALKESDRTHLHKLNMFMESDAPVKHVTRNIGKNEYSVSEVSFTHPHLASRLTTLGLVSHERKWRSSINEIPPYLLHHFIRGILDGDGCIEKMRPSIGFCGQRDLVIWLRSILAQKCSTDPNRKICQHSISRKVYYLKFYGYEKGKKIVSFIYHDATIFLKRKKDILLTWPNPPKRKRKQQGKPI